MVHILSIGDLVYGFVVALVILLTVVVGRLWRKSMWHDWKQIETGGPGYQDKLVRDWLIPAVSWSPSALVTGLTAALIRGWLLQPFLVFVVLLVALAVNLLALIRLADYRQARRARRLT